MESGLLLGEYMELVERAFLEAHALKQAGLLQGELDLQAAAVGIAAKLLISYSRRKRLFLLLSSVENFGWASVAGALPREAYASDFVSYVPSSVAAVSHSYKSRLSQRIHRRIEEMKRAGE